MSGGVSPEIQALVDGLTEKTEEYQAEIDQLRRECAWLEDECRRLKGEKPKPVGLKGLDAIERTLKQIPLLSQIEAMSESDRTIFEVINALNVTSVQEIAKLGGLNEITTRRRLEKAENEYTVLLLKIDTDMLKLSCIDLPIPETHAPALAFYTAGILMPIKEKANLPVKRDMDPFDAIPRFLWRGHVERAAQYVLDECERLHDEMRNVNESYLQELKLFMMKARAFCEKRPALKDDYWKRLDWRLNDLNMKLSKRLEETSLQVSL